MLLFNMVLFKSKRKDRVLDLTEKYRKQLDAATQRASSGEASSSQTGDSSEFNFLGSMASGAQPAGEAEEPISVNVEERKRKLTKRLVDMTNQIEGLSNQIYHLQQRVEVLERKSGIGVE